MRNNVRERVIRVLRIALGAIFIYAAVGKILDPSAFAADIDNYRMLPYFLVALMAAILPWLELSCGLLLIIGRWLPGATLLIMLMNLVFVIAIASALVQGLDIPCGCFALSKEASRVGLVKIIEDMMFLLAAFFIYQDAIGKE